MFDLKVISPQGIVYEDRSGMLSAPGVYGEFSVLTHHAPFVTVLRKGSLKIGKGTLAKRIDIDEGFLEVAKDKVVVLINPVRDSVSQMKVSNGINPVRDSVSQMKVSNGINPAKDLRPAT